jgi:3-phosphoshikimate 1-carboxyvinyltransferase
MRTIPALKARDATVAVPGSKSYTHRAMIAAALGEGRCRLTNALASQDTRLTRATLEKLGARFTPQGDDLLVDGTGGRLQAWPAPIDLVNSGTSMRLLMAVAALGQGTYVLTGSARMQARPVQALMDSLGQLGAPCRSLGRPGCPPVAITAGRLAGGGVTIDCRQSSQFLSALLLTAPLTAEGMRIAVNGGPVSRPYIDLTLEILERFGIRYERTGYTGFRIAGGQTYRREHCAIEADVSQASYFWAAAAVCGTRVTVRGLGADSRQGDLGILDLLAAMGCGVSRGPEGTTVTGGPLQAIEADMGDLPDMVPTLAVVAAFARGTTRIFNIGHLRIKESDRIAAVAAELRRMGIRVEEKPDEMAVEGGQPRGARIECYDDHRMAMSFAVAGLKAPGTCIADEGCVAKSFPGFWEVFAALHAS